jgi:multidrug resistance efflux pump
MDEFSQNHKVLVSRTEDLEDDMQVFKTDLDVMRIEMSSYRQDVSTLERVTEAWEASMKDIEMSCDNAHLRVEKVEERVDSMVGSIWSVALLSSTNARSMGLEVQRIQGECQMQLDGFFKKFERMNEVLDKKTVHMDEELDRVTALVGEKIEAAVTNLDVEFRTALESEERRYTALVRDVELLKSRLVSRLYPSGHVFGPLLSPFRSKFTRYSKSHCKKTHKNIL